MAVINLREASPPVHWKLACTPLLDEAIHHCGVKGGAGTPNCCQILRFQGTWENKKTLLLVWETTNSKPREPNHYDWPIRNREQQYEHNYYTFLYR
jgi:hypothetical protein